VRICEAQVADSAGLAEVRLDSYRTAYAGIFPQSYLAHFTYDEQERDWRDLLSSGVDDVLYVAETEAGEIVGCALGRPGRSEIPPCDGELVALELWAGECPALLLIQGENRIRVEPIHATGLVAALTDAAADPAEVLTSGGVYHA
jgi:hypothetical protein